MTGSTDRRGGGLGLLGAAVGIAGMTMCITLVFLAMRAVMGVGGSCADGGPYVSAQPCPDGATAAMLVGVFGLFLFGGVSIAFGARAGGIWSWAPVLAWSGLFGSLGWNFLDAGLFNPSGGIDPVGLGLGLMFWVMAGVPLVALLLAARAWPGSRTPEPGSADPGRSGFLAYGPRRPLRDVTPRRDPARTDALRAIAGDLGAAVDRAAAAAPARPGANPGAEPGDVVGRLERLAELRERGLLNADEYEAAKAAVLREPGAGG